MPAVLDLWKKTSALPLGDRIFSFAFSQKAPYFATIRPRFTVIEPNRAELVIPKRRGVHNHIGTVHAIALCNGLEAAMGALAEVDDPARQALDPQGHGHRLHRQGRLATSPASPRPTRSSGPPSSATTPTSRPRPRRARGRHVVIEGVIKLWVHARSS